MCLQDSQLFVVNRLEAQADQMPASHPADPHQADKGFDRAGQFRGFDAAGPDLAGRSPAKHRFVERDANAAHRDIGQGKFIMLPAQIQMNLTTQEAALRPPTFSHNTFMPSEGDCIFPCRKPSRSN